MCGLFVARVWLVCGLCVAFVWLVLRDFLFAFLCLWPFVLASLGLWRAWKGSIWPVWVCGGLERVQFGPGRVRFRQFGFVAGLKGFNLASLGLRRA